MVHRRPGSVRVDAAVVLERLGTSEASVEGGMKRDVDDAIKTYVLPAGAIEGFQVDPQRYSVDDPKPGKMLLFSIMLFNERVFGWVTRAPYWSF